MNCKFCNAELPEGVTLCPACGKEMTEELPDAILEAVNEAAAEVIAEETAEETTEVIPEAISEADPAEAPVKKTALWVKILAVVGALSLVAVLAGAVFYGVGASRTAKSYTVSDSKAEKVRDTVIATVGDLELTNSALQLYYWQSVNEFYNSYGYYLDSSVLDFDKPLDEQFYDEQNGATWQQYFLESALSSWSRYAALYMQAKEEGFQLSEEMQTHVDTLPQQMEEAAAQSGFESVEAMLHSDMGLVCDQNGYLDYLNVNIYASQYLDSVYDSMVPTMEEIEAYYAENEETLSQQGIVNDGSVTVDARHILICPKGGTEAEDGSITYSEEEWEQCRADAQKILDAWQAEDGTEDGFAQCATMYTEDPGSMASGGLYTDIYEGQMVPQFEEWCFDESRKYGDTGLVRTDYGYHIMFFVESREIWITNVSDTMIYERTLAMVDEAAAKWPMEANYKKIALSDTSEETAEPTQTAETPAPAE